MDCCRSPHEKFMNMLLHSDSVDLANFLRVVSAHSDRSTDVLKSPHSSLRTWLTSVVLNALIPIHVDTTSITACIAAADFVRVILTDASYSLDNLIDTQSFKTLFLLDLFSRLRECLIPSSLNFLSLIPAISHALTLVCDLICITPQEYASSVLKNTLLLAPNLREAVVNCDRGSVFLGNDVELIKETTVFIFQVFHLWRRAMKAQMKIDQLNKLRHDTSIHDAMLNTVEPLLTRGSTLLVPRTDDNLLPPVVVVQLMLRGMKTLSKSLSSMAPGAHVLRLQTQFDGLIQKLIFTTTSSSASGASTLSPCVEFLLSMSTLSSLPLQIREYVLCNSRQATDAVRRLILLGLDLAERSDPSNPKLCTLLESIKAVVVRKESSEFSKSYEAFIINLFIGQDAHLIRGLYLWLMIANKLSQTWYEEQHLIPNPHWTFSSLLERICYSSHLIVDWLVSPETEMLLYLVRYLQCFRRRTFEVPGPPTLLTGTGMSLPSSSEITDLVWPRRDVCHFLARLLRCLETLHEHGNIPFNPKALLRSLKIAVRTLEMLENSSNL